MKLNNFQKNFFIFFSVIVSVLVATLLWEKISLPYANTENVSGAMALRGYNPSNDTIRYIFFISLPLFVYLFSNYLIKNQTIRIRELIYEEEKILEKNHPLIIFFFFIFIIFIFFEFFSINFDFSNYKIDHAHDGNYLAPAQNYLATNNLWTSSILVHGASDIFYPVLMWKIFGVKSIGAIRVFPIFLILFLKILCVILSYQFTKILNINKNAKVLFFTIFTSILISMSHYNFLGAGYYMSHKDIYVILFLVFFIELFYRSKLRFLFIILTCLIATISIFLQIDRGSYINLILIFYFLYLIFAKKYNDAFLVFISLVVAWVIAVNLIGVNEFKAYLENSKIMALSGEFIHGLKYPEPFFSIGDNPDGARATRALILQLVAGLLTLNCLISNKNKLLNSQKIFILFLFFLSLIIFKNALGRSDGAHIRGSHDIPILIICFFILNYLLIFIGERNLFKNFFSDKGVLALSIIFLLFYYGANHNNYRINNLKNYQYNFMRFINLNDEMYLDKKTIELIDHYKKISEIDNCVVNVTYEDAIPFLLKKPSCTKYWTAWLASPVSLQKHYINEIKKIQPNYILYYSDNIKWDELEIYERIDLINNYILSNYEKFDELNGYIFLKKK